jgi:hypothetical protein
LIEQRACRDVVYDETIRQPWLAKWKTLETMRFLLEFRDKSLDGLGGFASLHIVVVLKEGAGVSAVRCESVAIPFEFSG